MFRYFQEMVAVFIGLKPDLIVLPVKATAHPSVVKNPKMFPFFQRARHAGDGTHVPCIVDSNLSARFRNRKGCFALPETSSASEAIWCV
jgi:hypothetical protein